MVSRRTINNSLAAELFRSVSREGSSRGIVSSSFAFFAREIESSESGAFSRIFEGDIEPRTVSGGCLRESWHFPTSNRRSREPRKPNSLVAVQRRWKRVASCEATISVSRGTSAIERRKRRTSTVLGDAMYREFVLLWKENGSVRDRTDPWTPSELRNGANETTSHAVNFTLSRTGERQSWKKFRGFSRHGG